MSTNIEDLLQRRRTFIDHALQLTNVGRWDSDDGRQWDIAVQQLRAISAEIQRLVPPEEDDEPGGDIDWGDGGPLSAS